MTRTSDKPTKIRKTIKYFYLSDRHNDLNGATLEDKIREAFNKENKYEIYKSCKNRLFPGNPNMFINHFYDKSIYSESENLFFGELINIDRKNKLFAIDNDLDQATVPITAFNPPNNKSWIISPLYFLSIQNHLIIMPSQALNASSLEIYLQWLLNSKSKVTEVFNPIFKSALNKNITGKDLSEILSIKIKNSSHYLKNEELYFDENDKKKKKFLHSVKNFALDASDSLRKIFGLDPLPHELYRNISENHKISVDIGFKFDSSVGKKDSSELINFFEVFRDMPDEMIEVVTRKSIIKNGSIKLQVSEDILTLEDNKTIDPRDAAKSMHAYYKYLVENGDIS